MTTEGHEATSVMRALLGRLEALDFDGIGALLDDEAVFDFPFGRGEATTGRAAIVAYLRQGMGGFLKSIRFTVQTIYPCEDPEVVIAEYTSVGERVAGGAYQNRYVGIVRARGGKILLFREYYNPSFTSAGVAKPD
jgi:ketosteroid isomerase-like protein